MPTNYVPPVVCEMAARSVSASLVRPVPIQVGQPASSGEQSEAAPSAPSMIARTLVEERAPPSVSKVEPPLRGVWVEPPRPTGVPPTTAPPTSTESPLVEGHVLDEVEPEAVPELEIQEDVEELGAEGLPHEPVVMHCVTHLRARLPYGDCHIPEARVSQHLLLVDTR